MEPEVEKIGKYDILSVLGKGAMGTIYQGIDPVIQRHVAIKTINTQARSPEEQSLKERFIREAQAAGRLQHPNIVGVYEYGEDTGQAFIAMEFVAGHPLTEKLQAGIQFRIPDICDIMTRVLDALSYAHSMGVIHRDIKPGNIMLADSGEVKVTDFGIARLESSTMTKMGTVLGTPGYMSPEQLVGEDVDHRSDIFSAGVLFYELLTGEKAFSGTTITSVMYKILNTQPPPPASLCPNIPRIFDEIIDQALAKKPEARFQSAKEFSEAITSALNESKAPIRKFEQQALTPEQHTVIGSRVGMLDTGTEKVPQTPQLESPDGAPIGSSAGDTGADSKGTNRSYLFIGITLLCIAIAAGWLLTPVAIDETDTSDAKPRQTTITDTLDSPPTQDSVRKVEPPTPRVIPEHEVSKATDVAVEVPAPTLEFDSKEGAYIALDNAVMRETPDAEAPQIGVLEKGQQIWVNGVSVDGNWYRMVRKEGKQAFVTVPSVREERVTDRYKSGQRLQDCDSCPELVVIPPGNFTMGSPLSETEREPSEGPQLKVLIDYPLAVGRYEVTLNEFNHFIEDTKYRPHDAGCNIYDSSWRSSRANDWNKPGFGQTGDHPVTCISWRDAKAYAKWLSDKTGHGYRLLSSSEWEYVARANISTERFWGSAPGKACRYANVSDLAAEKSYGGWEIHDCNDGFIYTAPVGSFYSNGFDVFDTLGNVFEWVEDCWNPDYRGSPTNGAPRTDGDCGQRVLRGGSWFSMPRYVRLAFRNRFDPDYRSSTFGFRIARLLE